MNDHSGQTCPQCKGAKKFVMWNSMFGVISPPFPCSLCGGTGVYVARAGTWISVQDCTMPVCPNCNHIIHDLYIPRLGVACDACGYVMDANDVQAWYDAAEDHQQSMFDRWGWHCEKGKWRA